MKRIEAILRDVRFQKSLLRIERLEQQRIFCRHGLEHLLDVARIAWILTMEEQLPLDKEIVYGAALLHDIGRDRQYEEQIPHHQASAGLAAEILPDAGYNAVETTLIVDAIAQHGAPCCEQGSLAQVLYQADKLSRNCFRCTVQDQCKWPEEKRNRTILW